MRTVTAVWRSCLAREVTVCPGRGLNRRIRGALGVTELTDASRERHTHHPTNRIVIAIVLGL